MHSAQTAQFPHTLFDFILNMVLLFVGCLPLPRGLCCWRICNACAGWQTENSKIRCPHQRPSSPLAPSGTMTIQKNERNATTATAKELNKYLYQNEKSTSLHRFRGRYIPSSTAMKIYGFVFLLFPSLDEILSSVFFSDFIPLFLFVALGVAIKNR